MKNAWLKIRETAVKRKKIIITLFSILLLIVLGAAGTAAYAAKSMLKISETEASEIVSKELDGEVTKMEKDWDYKQVQYEMTVKTDTGYHEVELDGTTGKIIAVEKGDEDDELDDGGSAQGDIDSTDDDSSLRETAQKPKVSVEAAVETALKEVKGTVTDRELDTENGILLYDIEISQEQKEFDVKVDAESGKVIKVEEEK
ncbi:PepSY domain-containing protein [Peribacillus sp. SCS-155]|uniref:PepSY domain-containing protein n=1 Tax=Peribacillus sedimenti TaxID=3115297 RepID=UPI0039061417